MVLIERSQVLPTRGTSVVVTERPLNPKLNTVWKNPNTGEDEVWNGSEWQLLGVLNDLTEDWVISENSITLTNGTMTASTITTVTLDLTGSVFFDGTIGIRMLDADTFGTDNTFIGFDSGSLNESGGNFNTYLGKDSGFKNLTGDSNVAIGVQALFWNKGDENVAIGVNAMVGSIAAGTESDGNVAVGSSAMQSITTGNRNIAIGKQSLLNCTVGDLNIAIGLLALGNVVSTNSNIGIGTIAGQTHADGSTALQTPVDSIYIGNFVRGKDESDDNTIVIGANTIGLGANTIVLGDSNITLTSLQGDIGINIAIPTAEIHVVQASDSAAQPVMRLDQADIDDSFIDFIGTSAADGSRSISSDTTEDSAKFGAIRIEINGTTKWMRIYDTES